MNKKLLILGVAVLVILVVGLSGCIDTDTRDDRFVGVWKDTQNPLNTITFLSDGTGSFLRLSMSWEIKDNKLVITMLLSGGMPISIYDYIFSDDNTLMLKDVNSGVSNTYTKQ